MEKLDLSTVTTSVCIAKLCPNVKDSDGNPMYRIGYQTYCSQKAMKDMVEQYEQKGYTIKHNGAEVWAWLDIIAHPELLSFGNIQEPIFVKSKKREI